MAYSRPPPANQRGLRVRLLERGDVAKVCLASSALAAGTRASVPSPPPPRPEEAPAPVPQAWVVAITAEQAALIAEQEATLRSRRRLRIRVRASSCTPGVTQTNTTSCCTEQGAVGSSACPCSPRASCNQADATAVRSPQTGRGGWTAHAPRQHLSIDWKVSSAELRATSAERCLLKQKGYSIRSVRHIHPTDICFIRLLLP